MPARSLLAKTAAEIAEAMAAHPLLAQLPEEVRNGFQKQGFVLTLASGEHLYQAGDDADLVFFLLSGGLQIEYPNGDDIRGKVVAMLAAPAFLGESQVLHEQPWSGTGTMVTDGTALGLRKPLLESLFLDFPTFGLHAYRELSARFLRAINAWKSLPSRGPEQVLARYILGRIAVQTYVDQVPTPQKAQVLGMNQKDLAQAALMRRETVNRILKRWAKDERVTLTKGALSEVDQAAIQSLLAPGDPPLFPPAKL